MKKDTQLKKWEEEKLNIFAKSFLIAGTALIDYNFYEELEPALLELLHSAVEEAKSQTKKGLVREIEALPKYDLSKRGIDEQFYIKRETVLTLLKSWSRFS